MDYCQKRNNNICAETFFDFYESKDWLIGKSKMKCWKSAVRTWEKRSPGKKSKLQNQLEEYQKGLNLLK